MCGKREETKATMQLSDTTLSTSLVVNEILADAVQRLQLGYRLPDESSASLTNAHGHPVIQSVSMTPPVGEHGHHLNGNDVLKPMTGRWCSVIDDISSCDDADTTLRADPEQRSPTSPLMGTSHVPTERAKTNINRDHSSAGSHLSNHEHSLLQLPPPLTSTRLLHSEEEVLIEFGLDQEKCGCSSIREITTSSTGTTRVAATINSSDKNRPETRTAQFPAFDLGLPYFLGNVLPGRSTQFDLAIRLNVDAKPNVVRSFVNGRSLDLCTVTWRGHRKRGLQVTITPPLDVRGQITIELKVAPAFILKLTALCVLPLLELPELIVAPPDCLSEVQVRSLIPFTQPVCLQVRSLMTTSKEVTLLPGSDSLPLAITPNEGDTALKLRLLTEGKQVASLKTRVETRSLQISLHGVQTGDVMALCVKNDEPFPVAVLLDDDVGGLIYHKEVSVPERQTTQVTVSRGYVRNNQPASVTVTFRVTLLSPTRIESSLAGGCCLTLAPTSADLRPDINCVVWLSETELTVTMFRVVEGDQRKPSPWKKVVRIEACHRISDYVQIVQEPNDPTQVVLRVFRPPRLSVGRLIFYRRKDGSNAFPYGFRYVVLPPEKPSLLWNTAAANAASRVYQMPPDRKVRVSNVGQCAVFVAIPSEDPDQGRVIAPGDSAELALRGPCRIIYGLECWRSLVRYRIAPYQAEIQTHIAGNHPPFGLEPQYLMTDFHGETDESIADKTAAEKIPGDLDTLLSLYRLFMSTVEEVRMQDFDSETSTFIASSL